MNPSATSLVCAIANYYGRDVSSDEFQVEGCARSYRLEAA
jgi:hypothetical protein